MCAIEWDVAAIWCSMCSLRKSKERKYAKCTAIIVHGPTSQKHDKTGPFNSLCTRVTPSKYECSVRSRRGQEANQIIREANTCTHACTHKPSVYFGPKNKREKREKVNKKKKIGVHRATNDNNRRRRRCANACACSGPGWCCRCCCCCHALPCLHHEGWVNGNGERNTRVCTASHWKIVPNGKPKQTEVASPINLRFKNRHTEQPINVCVVENSTLNLNSNEWIAEYNLMPIVAHMCSLWGDDACPFFVVLLLLLLLLMPTALFLLSFNLFCLCYQCCIFCQFCEEFVCVAPVNCLL